MDNKSQNSQNDVFAVDYDSNNYISSSESSGDSVQKKKRKLDNLSGYEIVPRSVVSPPVPKRQWRGGRGSSADWTVQESSVLLEAWGERYIKYGRKIRSEEWQKVAQKVSQGPNVKRTETQCRNRLDTLKKKYKKEKAKLAENVGATSQWVHFRTMDMILNPYPNSNQERALALVEQEGNPNPDSNLANGVVHSSNSSSSDEMRNDSCEGDSVSASKDASENEDVQPKKTYEKCIEDGFKLLADGFKSLADSINQFRETFDKAHTEKNKLKVDLETAKTEIRNEMELKQTKKMKKTHLKIAKILGLTSKDFEPSTGKGSE